ncbi:glycoside hydrolase family 104 protein [Enterobacter ludwigii]|nr:glycoside hydrolase family 104 protein [Enterobacter ludwigii]
MAKDNSEVIDSLLVSLGLDVDKKSFRTGMDALSGLKSTALQIGAMAGAVATFDSLTRGVAGTTNELARLARNTQFSISQIDLLKFALDRVGAGADNAYGIVQKITSLQQDAKEGRLNERSYWGGVFDPEYFKNLSGVDAINYLAGSYEKMNSDQRRWIRDGLGEGDNSALVRLLEGGSSGLNEAMKEFVKTYRQPSNELIDSSQEFQEQLALLKLNFDDLSKSISGPLLKSLNDLLATTNEFYRDNRSWIDSIASGSWYDELMKPTEEYGTKFRGWLKSFFADTGKPIAANNAAANGTLSGYTTSYLNNAMGIFPSAYAASLQPNIAEQSSSLSREEKEFLDLISKAEGTSSYGNSGYNTLFGGKQFDGYKDHPRQYFNHNGTRTSAAGRYQITAQSWDDAVKALGLTDFSPANQDKAALWLAQRAGQGENIRNGNITGAANGLRQVWTGLNSSAGQNALAGYYASANSIPQPTNYAGGAGSRSVTANNNIVINASGANADEVADLVFGQISDKTSQATAHLSTDKF